MCGRYYVDDDMTKEMEKVVRKIDESIHQQKAGDVYPDGTAAVLTGKKTALSAEMMHWGFLKYGKKGLLINARSETVLERPLFRNSILQRRCVIPARHFYEWDHSKNKVTFFREDGPVIYMAGFYNRFGEEDRFIILTTEANASMKPVHDRMPLILEEKELEDYIYDGKFLDFALHKHSPQLAKYQDYVQQSLF